MPTKSLSNPRPDSRTKPGRVKPMSATLADRPFDRPGWIFEVKWDGYRAIAEITRSGVSLYSRNQLSFNQSYPAIAASLRKIKHQAVLDGEIVVLDSHGRSRFQLLQTYRKTGIGPLMYYVFDLLELDGRDLRQEPLVKRRALLPPLIKNLPGIALSESVEEHGIEFFEAAVKVGLEGILAKDASSPYCEGRRSRSWLKIKSHNRQEAVIGGFTAPRGSREHLGALVLGLYEGDDLVYIGHTGGGSSESELRELRRRLDPLVQKTCPFRVRPKVNAPVQWVAPKLVCEVNFQEWSSGGRMRQPIFVGLREDKPARSVHREEPTPVDDNRG
jgi:bifunctional non-homologous end joining protein LigD